MAPGEGRQDQLQAQKPEQQKGAEVDPVEASITERGERLPGTRQEGRVVVGVGAIRAGSWVCPRAEVDGGFFGAQLGEGVRVPMPMLKAGGGVEGPAVPAQAVPENRAEQPQRNDRA